MRSLHSCAMASPAKDASACTLVVPPATRAFNEVRLASCVLDILRMAAAQHHTFDSSELRPAQGPGLAKEARIRIFLSCGDALRNYQRLNEIFVIITWSRPQRSTAGSLPQCKLQPEERLAFSCGSLSLLMEAQTGSCRPDQINYGTIWNPESPRLQADSC